MRKLLVVVDMQNDFVDGSLGTEEAEKIVPNVVERVKAAEKAGEDIIFTRDTHGSDYLKTQEGRRLPVVHCVKDTKGWEIIDELKGYAKTVIDKPSFGSTRLMEAAVRGEYTEIELIGLCTDICVVSNALLLKAALPEADFSVDASCCAGVTQKSHEAALETMQMCQIEIKR
ncbi:MAG: cysteine hydrolase [Coprococcus sp.]|nr:cysteine hydrolase [Coprococcus sp.]